VADDGSDYNNANTTMYGADLSFVKNLTPLLINVKGQYNMINVNKQSYKNPADSSTYSFDNKTTSAFAQISIRPISAGNKLLKNLELAFRYVNYKTPGNSFWGQDYNEEDIGLDYWLTWRTVVKFTYATSHGVSTVNDLAGGKGDVTKMENIYLQFAIGF
jgi:hypothetical protein